MASHAHKVTKEMQERVSQLKSYGTKNKTIAKRLGISEDTLERHYRAELDDGGDAAVSKVADTLYEKATIDKDMTAIIFYLKTRGRWRTADNETLLESNDKLKEEMRALRAELDAQNKKAY